MKPMHVLKDERLQAALERRKHPVEIVHPIGMDNLPLAFTEFEDQLKDMRADFPDHTDEDLAYVVLENMKSLCTDEVYRELCRCTTGFVPGEDEEEF
jgi:hypothetical protein